VELWQSVQKTNEFHAVPVAGHKFFMPQRCRYDAAMRFLDSQATAECLPWPALLAELQAACREHREGRVHSPERMHLPLPEGGTLLVMPALSATLSITKLVTVHPGNRASGRPTITGEVLVMDSRTGERLMQLDGPTVTARRTAAVSLLALHYLAAAAPQRALIVGTGVQAEAHAQALSSLQPQARLWVQGRDTAGSQRFSERLQMQGVAATPLPPSAQDSERWDLVLAATSSHTPVLRPGVGSGALVIGVGAFRRDMVELPAALLLDAEVFVDDLPGAHAEAGDLIAAGLTPDWPTLEDLVLGQVSPDPQRTRVFKSVGCARWDLAAACVAARSFQA